MFKKVGKFDCKVSLGVDEKKKLKSKNKMGLKRKSYPSDFFSLILSSSAGLSRVGSR